MRTLLSLALLASCALSIATSLTSNATAESDSANELVGLWEAKRRFGPDIRGVLSIRQTGGAWQAEIAGHVVNAKLDRDSVSFSLPDGKGDFHGKFDARRTTITGHWMQQRTVESGMRYVSPVTLTRSSNSEWRGNVWPIDDTHTFYLMVKPRADGSMGAFFRNPERNLGWFQYRVDRLERDGKIVKLFAANRGNEPSRLIVEGRYDPDAQRLSFYFQNRGGSFDFYRVPKDNASDFYARGRVVVTYSYTPPPKLDDGWQTARLEDVGLSRPAIENFIQSIVDTPIESANSQEDHGVLIARHGKLVLEEYFHGEHREKAHDTRSASKSVASDLMGAAIHAGVRVDPENFLYQVMNGSQFPRDLEPRKRALKVVHLLTMSSGLDCDDNDDKSPGFEDKMWEQTDEPDFYKWTMALKMVREPGEKAIYCSASPNLVGGVIKRAAGKPLPKLFQSLLAEPLNIKRYYLPTSPTGDVTFTGGHRFLPRDFMKLAQVHLNGGTWNGRRIFSAEWSRRATTPAYGISAYKLDYGYLWWVKDYPYKGRTVRAYFASGNGGQIAMAIPEFDLALAFYAGNYNDGGGRTATNVYVPQFILPAIEK